MDSPWEPFLFRFSQVVRRISIQILKPFCLQEAEVYILKNGFFRVEEFRRKVFKPLIEINVLDTSKILINLSMNNKNC